MDAKIKSTSNFDIGMSSTSSQNFDLTTDKNSSKIPVKTTDKPVIIPIKTSTDSRMTIDSGSGNYLKYIIDNETGRYIILEGHTLKLFSKTDKLLSATTIPTELPDYQLIRNKYLFVDEFGNLTWAKGQGSGGTYYSGLAISIGMDHKINLVYDMNTLYINDDGQVAVNLEKVQEKLIDGDNIIIEGNKISAKDTTYVAGEGISIDEQTHTISALTTDDYYYLKNKPSINGVELIGRMLGTDLKLDVIKYMTYKEYRNLEVKEPKLYFVCKNSKDLEIEDCWRIYLQNKLIGEWDVKSGTLTLPVFPLIFPFRFA